MENYILNDYFDWLYFTVVSPDERYSYRKLLSALHTIEFKHFIEYDENRAFDGVNLRWYYVEDGGDDHILSWKESCTVLEMLVALAMHMDNIVGDDYGKIDIFKWFWLMIENLDLAWMTDDKFDKRYVIDRVNMFMTRTYEPDGDGNIIYIPDCEEDLRQIEIWQQMCWYLDSIL